MGGFEANSHFRTGILDFLTQQLACARNPRCKLTMTLQYMLARTRLHRPELGHLTYLLQGETKRLVCPCSCWRRWLARAEVCQPFDQKRVLPPFCFQRKPLLAQMLTTPER